MRRTTEVKFTCKLRAPDSCQRLVLISPPSLTQPDRYPFGRASLSVTYHLISLGFGASRSEYQKRRDTVGEFTGPIGRGISRAMASPWEAGTPRLDFTTYRFSAGSSRRTDRAKHAFG